MSEKRGEPPGSPRMVGGVSAYGNKKPNVLILALKQGNGLLVWERVADRAARQWAEAPPLPTAEAELRAAHTVAMQQAPEGARPREGRGVGLPKVEVSQTGKVRVDVNWSGVQHHLYPTILSPAACADVWRLWAEPLRVAELPRPLPSRIGLSPADGGGFEWENQLQECLVTDWDKLPLSVTLEIMGREYPAHGLGRMDILCKNKDGSGFTVIELKRGRTGDAVVGQTLRYMAWVRENLVKDGQSVWGIITCLEGDPKLTAAVSEAPNVRVYTYVRQAQSIVLSPKKDEN